MGWSLDAAYRGGMATLAKYGEVPGRNKKGFPRRGHFRERKRKAGEQNTRKGGCNDDALVKPAL